MHASDRSNAVVLVLFLFGVALWFLLRRVSYCVLSCTLFSRFSVLFSIVITLVGAERGGPLTESHLKPKVTVRQFLGYRKIQSIYVETMLLFNIIGAWQSYWTVAAAKGMHLLGYETKTTYDDLKIGWLWLSGWSICFLCICLFCPR